MVGFKKVPTKSVLLTFLISIFLILLLYVDFATDESLPIEIIETSENFEDSTSDILSYQIHEVKDGENLSIIFEDFKVPLNTAYRIFRLDEKNLLSKIKPGDKMKFSYLGDEITNIEIGKDQINSLLIDLTNGISIKEISKDVELIRSFKSGVIKTSFYEAALDAKIPDSIIMDFAYIFGWDVDFVFDIREGDRFFLIYETPFSGGEKIKNGDIVVAKFINNGKVYKANRFFTDIKKKEFFDDEGNEMGPFIEDDWLLQNIYSLLNEKEIKIFDDWEVENQKEVINSIQTMYDDIQTYNNSTEKYEAKIYCWY